MRRHPPHYLSPARANARQGKTPKPAAAAPSHHSNAPNKPESQSILSKIVAHCIEGLPPNPISSIPALERAQGYLKMPNGRALGGQRSSPGRLLARFNEKSPAPLNRGGSLGKMDGSA
jgi:hypothetical protein